MTAKPTFLALSDQECRRILKRNHVGRLAFRRAREIDVEPLAYVASGDWVFLRSAYGAKLQALEHSPYAAFEVDEVRGPFDWRSVVAHGTVYVLPRNGGPIERRQFRKALDALRLVMPDALTPDDPVPERDIVYGLHIARLTGREAKRQGRKGVRRAAVSSRSSRKPRPPTGGF